MMDPLLLLYWFLPAYAANTAPPLLARLLPRWRLPLDLGRTWKGRPLLGRNKTWRGLLGGTILGALLFLLQQRLPLFGEFYASLPWYAGLLLAAGALVGDAAESFAKRRLARRPGSPWLPWDQLDFSLGALLLTWWLFWPGWAGALFLLVASALLTMLGHLLGWLLGITKEPL